MKQFFSFLIEKLVSTNMIEAPKLLNHENDAFIESKNIPR
ncbi:hypothetical protein pb186bvf_014216 [Paramecium bursaria]